MFCNATLIIVVIVTMSGNNIITNAIEYINNSSISTSKDDPFILPFDFHIVDKSFDNKKYTNGLIPFP